MSPPPPPAPPTEAPPCRRAKLTVDNSNLNDQGRLLPTPLRGGMIAGGGDKLGGGALRYTHTPANETPTSLLSPLLPTLGTSISILGAALPRQGIFLTCLSCVRASGKFESSGTALLVVSTMHAIPSTGSLSLLVSAPHHQPRPRAQACRKLLPGGGRYLEEYYYAKGIEYISLSRRTSV